MAFNPGDTLFLEGSTPDWGAQAWADAWSVQQGQGPVVAAMYFLGVRPFTSVPATVPPLLLGQLIRATDGYRAGVAGGGGFAGPYPLIWANITDDSNMGVLMWVTLWDRNGQGHPAGNRMPDGHFLTAAEVPADSLGVILVVANCTATAGNGGGYELIVPGTPSTPGGPAQWLAGFTWDLQFTSIATSGLCGGGGGNQPPPPPPTDPNKPTAGIDLLYWRQGYHVAQVQEDGLNLFRRWHYDTDFDFTAQIDAAKDCTSPQLSHPHWGPPLSIVYARGTGTDQALFRKESYDYGATWISDPEDGKPFKTASGGLAHSKEAWNERTGERCFFYISSGIKVDIYGPDLVQATGKMAPHGTFNVTTGTVDNTSFGAQYVRQFGALEVVFTSNGVRKIFRSNDDGRTWLDVS